MVTVRELKNLRFLVRSGIDTDPFFQEILKSEPSTFEQSGYIEGCIQFSYSLV